jgi:hypothetical protein
MFLNIPRSLPTCMMIDEKEKENQSEKKLT